MAEAFSSTKLKSLIEKIERLEEEKSEKAADVREIYTLAKSEGFDVKIMRQVIRLRKLDHGKRQEEEALLETYLAALGMGFKEAA